MSFASLNPIQHYPHMHSFNTAPQHLQNPYIMLPPLRSTTFSSPRAFTLSDCSDLSSTTSPHDPPVQVPTYSIPHAPPSPDSPVAIIPSPLKEHLKLKHKPQRKIPRARTRLQKLDPSLKPSATLKKVRSSKSNIPGESRYWTPSEHKLFVEALLKYGPKDLKAISSYVGTRNMIQCRTHEQKCFMRLMREAQRETMQRNGQNPDTMVDARGKKIKSQKDVYSVSSSCGISLLCVVSEEMARSLQS